MIHFLRIKSNNKLNWIELIINQTNTIAIDLKSNLDEKLGRKWITLFELNKLNKKRINRKKSNKIKFWFIENKYILNKKKIKL